jgi:hypothetical protein
VREGNAEQYTQIHCIRKRIPDIVAMVSERESGKHVFLVFRAFRRSIAPVRALPISRGIPPSHLPSWIDHQVSVHSIDDR